MKLRLLAPTLLFLSLSITTPSCFAQTSAASPVLADVSTYKTFGWDKSVAGDDSENPSSVAAVARKAIITQMAARGYRLDDVSPQMVVRLTADVQSQDAKSSPPDSSTDLKKPASVVVIRGLTLSMSDAKTGQLLWRNTSDVSVDNAKAKIPAKVFQDTIAELYQGYSVAPARRLGYGDGYVRLPPPPEQNNEIKMY